MNTETGHPTSVCSISCARSGHERRRKSRDSHGSYGDRGASAAGAAVVAGRYRARPSGPAVAGRSIVTLTEKGRRRAGANFADLAIALWEEIRSIQDPEGSPRLARRSGRMAADTRADSWRHDRRSGWSRCGVVPRQIPFDVERSHDLPLLRAVPALIRSWPSGIGRSVRWRRTCFRSCWARMSGSRIAAWMANCCTLRRIEWT